MEELNTIQEDLVLDQQRDFANEIDDGKMDTWIHNHHSDLVNEYIEDNSDDFDSYCKNRWDEVNE